MQRAKPGAPVPEDHLPKCLADSLVENKSAIIKQHMRDQHNLKATRVAKHFLAQSLDQLMECTENVDTMGNGKSNQLWLAVAKRPRPAHGEGVSARTTSCTQTR
mmetsp:Transcript_28990/g.40410  ORF Transcript_28990/g.40410 Transcript_28990/m.40410 type:complete len:104 (-) Transcript_28990:329-640(-)